MAWQKGTKLKNKGQVQHSNIDLVAKPRVSSLRVTVEVCAQRVVSTNTIKADRLHWMIRSHREDTSVGFVKYP